jgi:uncharacterized membrane protein YqgA involved in biofilm formation
MLKLLLSIYGVADAALLVFLFKQYRMLVKSDEYTSDSLMNKFIVGFLAVGGMMLVATLFIASIYCIFQ